ncbi:hypothetical protein FGA82_25510 [Pseudomonas fluorescens]|uniref:EamA family transporter n=1 Tax=Pseudomonas fluorescens TaxID=294 RepID=UPI0011329ED0|nr:EamA family transporter [Pseudomonas fluorescens]TMU71864.1 hypothetical protein FGA82_25510 [Pseudomonas fluorescens]
MQKKHLLLAVLVTAVWGLSFPVTKLGLADIDPLLLTALRFTLAGLPWVFFVERPRVAFRWLAAYGMIFGVAMWALINLGIAWGWNLLLREYPVSHVAPLSLLIPVFGIVGSMIILGQNPGLSNWALILLVLSALALGSGKVQVLLVRLRGSAQG